jgi:diguanylate cyclase (GGDEF)-like protein
VGLLLIAGIGLLDTLTGYELSFSLFYLIPISLTAWYAGRRIGISLAFISALTWLVADFFAGHFYSHPFIYIWNALIRLGIFVIVAFLLAALRHEYELEKELARVDPLTGAFNSRYFFELMQIEIDRLQRYQRPFTIAYLDLDNFKLVNDRFGHAAGDQVLQVLVSGGRKQLRKTDMIARLGGDEFAILLPETDQAAARVVLTRLQNSLVDVMEQRCWPVTLSIGVLTVHDDSITGEAAVQLADQLMYTVKKGDKNAISFSSYPVIM